jgi:hypothetical protein
MGMMAGFAAQGGIGCAGRGGNDFFLEKLFDNLSE